MATFGRETTPVMSGSTLLLTMVPTTSNSVILQILATHHVVLLTIKIRIMLHNSLAASIMFLPLVITSIKPHSQQTISINKVFMSHRTKTYPMV